MMRSEVKSGSEYPTKKKNKVHKVLEIKSEKRGKWADNELWMDEDCYVTYKLVSENGKPVRNGKTGECKLATFAHGHNLNQNELYDRDMDMILSRAAFLTEYITKTTNNFSGTNNKIKVRVAIIEFFKAMSSLDIGDDSALKELGNEIYNES